MKTIKFRIYDKQQNKMIESGATPTMLESFFEHTAVLHTKDEMPYQQFTGLLDKQGKDIYEDDVVEYYLPSCTVEDDKIISTVEYYQGMYIAMKVNDGPLSLRDCINISNKLKKGLKIIGNIYE